MTFITDTEARTQICPHMTFCVNENDVNSWRHSALYVHQLCQGSDCKMAWRWWFGRDHVRGAQRTGYCGIAGRPNENE